MNLTSLLSPCEMNNDCNIPTIASDNIFLNCAAYCYMQTLKHESLLCLLYGKIHAQVQKN
jgi:hypothetical protein